MKLIKELFFFTIYIKKLLSNFFKSSYSILFTVKDYQSFFAPFFIQFCTAVIWQSLDL
jgi:hypothetical protein